MFRSVARLVAVIALLAGSGLAQPRKPPNVPVRPKPPIEVPVIEGDVIEIGAKNRKLLFMTFLERTSEELERASLQKRSFIPELVKTVDAETL